MMNYTMESATVFFENILEIALSRLPSSMYIIYVACWSSCGTSFNMSCRR